MMTIFLLLVYGLAGIIAWTYLWDRGHWQRWGFPIETLGQATLGMLAATLGSGLVVLLALMVAIESWSGWRRRLGP